jgi:hypothetical protein
MNPGPNDPITPELLRQWNPGGPQGGMGLDPSYSDRYLLDEGSKDTLGNLIQTLQRASNQTENIDAGLGRLQGLQEEQKANLQPLWDQGNGPESPGFLDRLSSGLGSVGGAVSNGLDAITPSQGTIDNIAMRLQNAHAIGTGRAPLWMQMQEHQANMSQAQELMQMRRAQAAHQMAQLEETKRQNQWEDTFKVLGSNLSAPQQIQMLKTMGKQNPIAHQASQVVNDKLLADFNMVKNDLGEPVEKIAEKLQTGEMTWHDLAAKVNVTSKMKEEERHALVKEEAERKQIQSIADQYDKDPSSVSLTQKLKLKEYYTKHGKLDEELQQLHLANKNTQLGIKDKELESSIKHLMPQTSEEIPMADGKFGKYVIDPQTMTRKFVQGEKKPLIEGQKGSEIAEAEYLKETRETYNKLKFAPTLLNNIEQAKALIPKAKSFMGSGGETYLNAAKFLNSWLKTSINPEGIKSAEEFRARAMGNLTDMLKKIDPNPTENQMHILSQALGNLGTDPSAVSNVLDVFGDTIREKVEVHNKDVEGAMKGNRKFPYDPRIQLPPKQKGMKQVGTHKGKPVYEDESGKRWIDQ